MRECAVAAYSQYVDAMGMEPAPMRADFSRHLERGELFVIADDGGPVGYLVWWMASDHLFVDNIAVLPSSLGKGVARFVFDQLEKRAIAARVLAIELYTNVMMKNNLKLYPHLGFVETERRHEHGFDRVYFRKTLSFES